LKDRAKLILGAAVYPRETRRWTRYVREHPVLRHLAPACPRIVHKIYRPYLSKHLNCEERVAALMSHYSAIADAGLGQLVLRAARAPVTIAQFNGKSGAPLALALSAINVAHREGELALLLVSEGRTVYTASFALLATEGQMQLALGSLQGLRAVDGADVIRRLTRELYGCRPKNFLVALLRHLGQRLDCARLVLVSNRNRIAINWKRSVSISSDYDATWRELDATTRADGNFELACEPAACPDLAQVPARKRSEVRKRHALLSDVAQTAEGTLFGAPVGMHQEAA
jgi:hypothetical protein